MKAQTEIICPGCHTAMVCVVEIQKPEEHSTFNSDKSRAGIQHSTSSERPTSPPKMRPSEKEVLGVVMSGVVYHEEIATLLGKTYAAVVSVFESIKERFGVRYKDKEGLRKLAKEYGIEAAIGKKAQGGSHKLEQVGKKPTFNIQHSTPNVQPLSPKERVASALQITLKQRAAARGMATEHEDSNVAVLPSSEKAIKLGYTLVEPFSTNDVAARLDTARNGTPAISRAGIWMADWLQRGWIANCGFRMYRRTEKFGK